MTRKKTVIVRICNVEVLEGYRVQLGFTDGTSKVIDLAIYLHGPIFEPIRDDPAIFRTVRVDPQLGTIVWDNGADIDADVLYLGLKPAWMESEQPAR
jgi:hypothetical protein